MAGASSAAWRALGAAQVCVVCGCKSAKKNHPHPLAKGMVTKGINVC